MKYFLLLLTIFLMSCANTNITSKSQVTEKQSPSEAITIEQIDTSNEEASIQVETQIAEEENVWNQNCVVFDDFSKVSDYSWGIVNDGVMWGKSQWFLNIENNTLVFSGTIVTRGWGFSSLRGWLNQWVLSEYNTIKLRAKSDNREYKVTFRDSNNPRISHQAVIPFQTPWEFEEVTIPFTALEPSYFGRTVNTDAFDKDTAQQMGVILSDWVDWEFRLEIEEVRFCR